jgi:hypothetical protein
MRKIQKSEHNVPFKDAVSPAAGGVKFIPAGAGLPAGGCWWGRARFDGLSSAEIPMA